MTQNHRVIGRDAAGAEHELREFSELAAAVDGLARGKSRRVGDILRAEWLLAMAQDYERIEIEIDGRRQPLVRRHRFARREL